jgi:hypothetical protein
MIEWHDVRYTKPFVGVELLVTVAGESRVFIASATWSLRAYLPEPFK